MAVLVAPAAPTDHQSSRKARWWLLGVAMAVLLVVTASSSLLTLGGSDAPHPNPASDELPPPAWFAAASPGDDTRRTLGVEGTSSVSAPKQPVMCGPRLLAAHGLTFRVEPAEELAGVLHVSVLTGNTTDVVLVGRAWSLSSSRGGAATVGSRGAAGGWLGAAAVSRIAVPDEESRRPTTGQAALAIFAVDFRSAVAAGVAATTTATDRRSGRRPRETIHADVVVTWVGTRFVGQNWHLPNRNVRNARPSKLWRLCLALTLTGDGCGRFGTTLFNGTLPTPSTEPTAVIGATTAGTAIGTNGSKIAWAGVGVWRATSVEEDIGLNDPVGTNRFAGRLMEWVVHPSNGGQPIPMVRSPGAVLQALDANGIRRIVLFGDSMAVELYHQLRRILAGTAGTRAAAPADRSSKFVTSNVELQTRETDFGDGRTLVFLRVYGTKKGQSQLVGGSIIAHQLVTLRPDAVVGNAAMLHWEQNGRTPHEWTQQLVALRRSFERSFPAMNGRRRRPALFLGPALIQMGRTSGLNPQRTVEFGAAAREALHGVFTYVDPMQLTTPRREAAPDGQHYSCGYQWGGVAHTIAHLVLRQMAPDGHGEAEA